MGPPDGGRRAHVPPRPAGLHLLPAEPHQGHHARRRQGLTAVDAPAWLKDAVLYGVIPNRFGPEGLRSVTARLPDLADLGVNGLWLSPIARSPAGDYGYAVTDYLAIDPRHGTDDDLRELVRKAHALGIRVLLDVVPNHTSDQHPFFRDAEERGPASPYWDWYDRGDDGRPTHYFGWTNLPNLNFDLPAVREHVLEASRHWIREFDVDGYRVDVAWGVQERAPDFWPVWRRELKALKPDVALIAEASARDPAYVGHGFDAAYDWTDELGQWAWQDVFDVPDGLVARLHAALTNDGRGYPPGARVLRFLANNDTGPRFAAVHDRALTRVAAALLLTLPGIPCLFTGDELALAYQPYDGGGPLDWDGDGELRAWWRRLIALRHDLPALRSDDWSPVDVEGSDAVYGYLRPGGEGGAVLVVLNFAGETVDVTLAAGRAFDGSDEALVDHLDGEGATVAGDGRVAVRIPAHGVRVLARPASRQADA